MGAAARAVGALLVVVVAASCSVFQPATPTPTAAPRYAGFLSFGGDVHLFGPCEPIDQWWVADASIDMSQQYSAAAGSAYHPVYAIVEGNVSGTGRFGSDGSFGHEIVITRLVALDAARNRC